MNKYKIWKEKQWNNKRMQFKKLMILKMNYQVKNKAMNINYMN